MPLGAPALTPSGVAPSGIAKRVTSASTPKPADSQGKGRRFGAGCLGSYLFSPRGLKDWDGEPFVPVADPMSAQVVPHPSSLLGGKYALLRELGSGGVACVYEAENVLVGKRVAVKVLDEKLARNVTVRARFLAEARAAAQLNHPNVVDIHDVGDERGGLYIVMELLSGETLAQVLASRGALPVPYACELVLQVLTALDAAHARGIVHRDLKPENVLVTHPRPDQPLVKVLDFGIAQGIAGAAAEPEGRLMGTPAYMAPEQALGRRVDHRADLYSCGAVLYELLCGEPPFRGRTPMQILGSVLKNEYRPLCSCAPHVPIKLRQLVDELLQPSASTDPKPLTP